jgi:hypothetical protein
MKMVTEVTENVGEELLNVLINMNLLVYHVIKQYVSDASHLVKSNYEFRRIFHTYQHVAILA